MEKLITKIDELKNGDLVLTNHPLTNEEVVGVVDGIYPTLKYAITDENGRKFRMDNRKQVFADEVGETGDEKIMKMGISLEHGTLTLNELDDIKSWNLKKIDESHPKYDKDMAKGGKMIGDLFDTMQKMEDDGEELLGNPDALGKLFGGLFVNQSDI